MALTFGIYADAGLTVLAPNPLSFTFPEDEVPGVWQNVQLWIGSPVVGKQIRSRVNPGLGNIIVNLIDANPGSFPNTPQAELSLDDIAYVTPTLDLGVQEIDSGVVNAVTFFLQTQIWAGPSPGTYGSDVSFTTQELEETEVP